MNKILYNPEKFVTSDSLEPRPTNDIIDYPIAEAAKGLDGEPMYDANMGTYRGTGRTLEVSIKRGEAVEFEGYIADILLDRYGFLQERVRAKNVKDGTQVADAESKPEDKVEEAPIAEAGKFACKGCQKTFNATDELGLHVGMKHPEFLTGK